MVQEINPIFVIATASEVKLVADIFKADHPQIMITGVGGTNVIQALRKVDRNTPIINVGYAGAVGMRIGQIAHIGKVRLQHETPYEEKTFDLGGNVDCFTSCDFIPSDQPGVYDMELAFICALGFKDVKAVKVVSDNIDYEQYKEHINGNG